MLGVSRHWEEAQLGELTQTGQAAVIYHVVFCMIRKAGLGRRTSFPRWLLFGISLLVESGEWLPLHHFVFLLFKLFLTRDKFSCTLTVPLGVGHSE